MTLFERIFDKSLLARRINLVACNVIKESDVPESESYEQLSLFDTEETIQDRADDEKALEKERALQEAMLTIKHKFGKNTVLKGTNFTEGATAKERNRQIGDSESDLPQNEDYAFIVGLYNSGITQMKLVAKRPFHSLEEAIPPPTKVHDPISDKYSIYKNGELFPPSYEECKDLETCAVWELNHVIDRLMGDDKRNI